MASPILLFISIIFFLIIIHRLFQRLRYNLPPGPRPWPIIGNLDKLNPVHKRQRFAEWSKTYGPIISVWFGSTLNVVISNSELAKQGLKDNDQRLADRYRNRRLTLSFKNGQDLVWADYGSHYVKVSKVCTLELFSPKSIEALRPIREDEVRNMIESIYKDLNNPDHQNYGGGGGRGLVLRKYLGSVAFNNITRMVFGKKFVSKQGVMDEQGLEFKAVLANEYMLGASLGLVEHIWWLNWMSWLGNDVTLSEILARKDRLTRSIIEEHKAKGMKKNNNGGGGGKPHFVDALLGLQEKYEFSEDTIILYQRLRYNLTPGPRPWPILGNLDKLNPVLKRQRFAEWSKTYGPIISVWFGSTLNVVISNSELAKQGLKDNDQQLADRYRNRTLALIFKNGQDLIWADYGSHYVKVRKVCTLELFSPKSIEALRPIREDEVRAMIESIYKDLNNNYGGGGGGLVLRKYLGSVAFNNITRLVFGKKFVSKQGVIDEQGLEFKAVLANEFMLGASLGLVEHIWWLNWMSRLGNDLAVSEILARKDRLTRAIMEEHKAKNMKKINGGVKQHFVDALLGLQEKYELSEETIMLLLWNMTTAGMDTVAITVEWAMAELVKNPKAQQEMDRVIGLDRVMIESDISDLPYLQCRRICPAAQLAVNLVTLMIGHKLHHFKWKQPEAVRSEEIDMSESPGLVCYMLTPLQAVPTPRLPAHLHEFETWD
ncbi:hypothetical protein LWI29_023896 [Acer saccharum]|uniref:Cytochrome P450 n=1 Tax=Acer saccharum TaxID=4024 RepID=A0AA39VNR6_ACESA|nr:hypothetical protein LWI29_023896 [Acer saccharum]